MGSSSIFRPNPQHHARPRWGRGAQSPAFGAYEAFSRAVRGRLVRGLQLGASGAASGCHSPHQSPPPVCGQMPTCRSFSWSMGGRAGGIRRHSPQSGPRASSCVCRQNRQVRQLWVSRTREISDEAGCMGRSVCDPPGLEMLGLRPARRPTGNARSSLCSRFADQPPRRPAAGVSRLLVPRKRGAGVGRHGAEAEGLRFERARASSRAHARRQPAAPADGPAAQGRRTRRAAAAAARHLAPRRRRVRRQIPAAVRGRQAGRARWPSDPDADRSRALRAGRHVSAKPFFVLENVDL